ncbi:cyanase [Roseomonas sp. NAR14]|uniref:Cyanate hydratase n=2 Tax=Roseomonas acroporae TaxID=2937791 RepID=A0A9X1YCN5_9PROT|nr:cyanase [Roseomonas acroporae]MCK8787716.1 cyanase [Roseomonas acroporae]
MSDRAELTEKIVRIKIERDLSWSGLAAMAGDLSKEYVTAGLLGQMPLPKAAAEAIGAHLELTDYEIKLLQVPPYRGSLPTQVPTDPLIYRFYELISVYGTTFKALIHEEFGDGIMSAIDFRMDLRREANNAGDRVNITMSGKFLPYKQY